MPRGMTRVWMALLLWGAVVMPGMAGDPGASFLDERFIAPLPDPWPNALSEAAGERLVVQRLAQQRRFSAQMVARLRAYQRAVANAGRRATQAGQAQEAAAAVRQEARITAAMTVADTGRITWPVIEALMTAEPGFLEQPTRQFHEASDPLWRDFLTAERRLLLTYVTDLAHAGRALIQAGDLEAAQALEAERERRDEEVLTLQDAIHAGGWRVLFCSNDPAIWNSAVDAGPDHRAVALEGDRTLRSFTGFIRLRRMDSGDAVILQVRSLDLSAKSDVAGGFIWKGAVREESKGVDDRGRLRNNRLLGIADTRLERVYGGIGDVIVNLPGRGRGYGGWGFARAPLVYSEQHYAWGEQRLERVVFEIALKRGDLTREELGQVLNQ